VIHPAWASSAVRNRNQERHGNPMETVGLSAEVAWVDRSRVEQISETFSLLAPTMDESIAADDGDRTRRLCGGHRQRRCAQADWYWHSREFEQWDSSHRWIPPVAASATPRRQPKKGTWHPARDAPSRQAPMRRIQARASWCSRQCQEEALVRDFHIDGVESQPRGKPETARTHRSIDGDLGNASPYGRPRHRRRRGLGQRR
jgi:hypothetical protein